MHAPTWPVDTDYARTWDYAQTVCRDAQALGIDLRMDDFAWDCERGEATIDGMEPREWVEAMGLD